MLTCAHWDILKQMQSHTQVGKLARTRADILLKLTTDLPATTRKLLGLRELFPGVNVSLLVSRWPYLVRALELLLMRVLRLLCW